MEKWWFYGVINGWFFFTVAALIYWRDPKKSGIVFGAIMSVLLSLAYFSLISVVAYISLLTLTCTVAFRIYKTVLQAVQKTSDGHPFKLVTTHDKSLKYFNSLNLILQSFFLQRDPRFRPLATLREGPRGRRHRSCQRERCPVRAPQALPGRGHRGLSQVWRTLVVPHLPWLLVQWHDTHHHRLVLVIFFLSNETVRHVKS